MGLPEEGGAVVYHQAKVARVAPGTRASANQAPSLQQEGKGRGSKLVVVARQGGLTPDRVWARRAARRTVAFDCSHQTTGAGGESGQGWGRRRVHMPTPPNQGCPRATLWPPIAPPAQLPLHQRAWSSSPAPKCRGLEGVWLHRRVRQRPAELFMRPLSLATLHPAHPQCTLTNNRPNSQHSRLILFKEILKYAQNMEIYGLTMHKGLDFDNDLVFSGHMYSYHRQNDDHNLILKTKKYLIEVLKF